MSVDSKEVELKIIATNQSKPTIDAVAKSISELTKAVNTQAEAAKKGELSLDELRATSLLLKKAQDEILSQKNLINQYNDTAKSAATLADRQRKATAAYDDYVAKVSASGVITEKQAARLASLARSVESAGEAISKNADKTAKLKSDLESAGADVNDLTTSMKALDAASSALTPAFEANSASLKSFSSDLRTAKNAEQEAIRTAQLFEQTQKKYADAARVRAAEHAAFAEKRANRNAEAAANARIFAQEAAEAKQQRELLALKNQMIARAEKEIAQERQLADAKKKTEEAARKKAEAERKANEENNIFNTNGRTTLSLLQRIRGEVLGLAAAYVGLNAAIGLAKGSIDAQSSREGTKNQLALSVGDDKAAIDAEYEYVRAQSDRIGLQFERTAKSYAKFAAAAAQAGRSNREIRYIFEAFSEVGRVANLTADDLDGVYRALEQITSKGKIQAEELRGQLGDRLFGAFQIAAKALKDTYPDLDKAMKNGVVTSEQLIAIAEKYRETVANRLPDAMKGTVAQQERFNNALYDFKLAIADSGFGQAFTDFLIRTTELLKSDDAAKFAQALGDGFTFVLDVLEFVVTHLEEIKLLVTLWLGVKGVAAIFAFTTAIKAMNFQLTVANGLMGKLQKGVLLIAAAFAGWQIGTYLRENFEEVRQFGVALVTGMLEMWTRIKYGAEIAWEGIKFAFGEGIAFILNSLTSGFRDLLGIMEKGARAIGKTALADNLAMAIDRLTVKTQSWGDRTKKITADFRAELQRINDIGFEMFQDAADKKVTKAGPNPLAEPTVSPGVRSNGGVGVPSAEELKKRANAIQEIVDALSALDARIGKRNKENLDARLGAIDSQTAPLRAKIKELGGTDAEKFEKELNDRVNALKLQETRDFNDELIKEHESLLSKIDAADAKAGKKQEDSLATRLAAIDKEYRQLYVDIEDARKVRVSNGRDVAELDSMRARLDLAIEEQKHLAAKKFILDEIKANEKLVNEAMDERKSLLDTIAAKEEAGNLTVGQASEERAKAIAEMQPKLEALTEQARQFALANASILDPAALDAYLANLDKIDNSYKKLGDDIYTVEQSQRDMAAGLTATTKALVEGLGKAIFGAESLSEAFRNAGRTFLQFAADFLMRIAEMIIQQQILNGLQALGLGFGISGGGSLFGAGAGGGGVAAGFGSGAYNFSGITGIPVMHSGGVVGTMSTTRSANPGWFANAPKYHTGGMIGMQPDEYRAILKKNEEVLTESDPRNILNGGAAAAGGAQGGAAAPPQNIAIHNAIDAPSMLEAALATPTGTKILFNFIRANRTTFKTALNN